MTTVPVTVTEDLQKALIKIQQAIEDYSMPTEATLREAISNIEGALTKIQVLRCSTIAELDKL